MTDAGEVHGDGGGGKNRKNHKKEVRTKIVHTSGHFSKNVQISVKCVHKFSTGVHANSVAFTKFLYTFQSFPLVFSIFYKTE